MINKFFIVNVYSCSGKESSEASFKYTQTVSWRTASNPLHKSRQMMWVALPLSTIAVTPSQKATRL